MIEWSNQISGRGDRQCVRPVDLRLPDPKGILKLLTFYYFASQLSNHYIFLKGTWEELDDAVYFVKAGGNTVEFLCAVLLFLNGAWILVSGLFSLSPGSFLFAPPPSPHAHTKNCF